MKYKYKNLRYERYWNNWNVYYLHDNGNRELVGYTVLSKKYAEIIGKMHVDYMNGKEV